MSRHILYPSAQRLVLQFGLRVVLTYASAVSVSAQSIQTLRGEKLFHGAETITARLAGHATVLSPARSACVNCHEGAISSVLEVRIAPLLNCATLRKVQPRRGGPAVAYEKETFCRTLRSGIDPNHVILARTMPRFELDQTQCEALWAYLVEQENCHEKN